jgi:HEAT repeat protein
MILTVQLLYGVLLVLVPLALGMIAAIFGHAGWLAWRRRFDPPRLARARTELAGELTVSGPIRAGPGLTALPHRLRRQLLLDVAMTLHGGERQRLAACAVDLGIVAEARRWTGSRWWWRRLRGAHLLASLGTRDPVLDRLLDDPHPAVRGQAIMWAADHVDAALADRLVGKLGDESPLCRHSARDALLGAGGVAVPAVAAGLARGEGGGVAALLDIAAERPDPRYRLAAWSLAEDHRPAVRAGAVQLLGALAGDDAVAVLERRLVDPDDAVRQAAASALGRLGHWPAASAVAQLLRDPSWDVRLAAGEALTHLGAPGALMLQRYRRDSDPFAADMAERVAQTAQLRSTRTGEIAARRTAVS